MKKIIILFISFLMAFQLSGQLASGSFAPNFTGTDIDGNTWTLYELLDQGKSVILDISATWCGPCWGYHETKILDDLHHTYGPDGTDELIVFLIEGDETTNLDCLYGTDDCNSFSYGDWTEGTGYPIIDDANIATLYEVAYFPTLYHICPNRIVTEMEGQPSVSQIYNRLGSCQPALGDNNFAVVDYNGFYGNYCTSVDLEPSVLVQNLGAEKVTSATINLLLNGSLVQALDWTGDLNTYQTQEISFDNVVLDENTTVEIDITDVNGAEDEYPENNKISTFANLADEFSDNIIILEITPLDFNGGYESYWEIEDANGNIIYSGGNLIAVGTDDDTDAYPDDEITRIELALPSDGCYFFNFYDAFEDGYDNVTYRFLDSSDNLIMEGPSVKATKILDVKPMELNGGTDIQDNINFLTHSDEGGYFCYDYNYTPTLTMQNVGSNEINTMKINAMSSQGGLLYEIDWTGSITPAGFAVIDLNEILVNESSEISYNIVTVNGNADGHALGNTIITNFENTQTKSEAVTLEILFDIYAEGETYWYFINSAGDTLETGLGTEGTLFTKELTFESGVDDCYEVLLKDDFGDGIQIYGPGESYLKIIDASGSELVNMDLTSVSFTELPILMEVELRSSAVSDLTEVEGFKVYPNPATDLLSIEMETNEGMMLDVSIIDAYGQQVSKQKEMIYDAGRSIFDVEVNHLDAGIYLLELSNDSGVKSRKFTILR